MIYPALFWIVSGLEGVLLKYFVILHDKKDSADVIKLIWRLGDYPRLSHWVQYNQKDSFKGKSEARKSDKEIWQWKQRSEWRFEDATLSLEWRKGLQTKECRWPLKAGKDKETDSPL